MFISLRASSFLILFFLVSINAASAAKHMEVDSQKSAECGGLVQGALSKAQVALRVCLNPDGNGTYFGACTSRIMSKFLPENWGLSKGKIILKICSEGSDYIIGRVNTVSRVSCMRNLLEGLSEDAQYYSLISSCKLPSGWIRRSTKTHLTCLESSLDEL